MGAGEGRAEEPPPEDGQPRRVLLVDDEPLLRRIVRVVVEAEGYEVTEASDGDAALASLDENPPDAVVLDLVIPGTDGYTVCGELTRRLPDVKVLVLSSLPLAESEPKARAMGAMDVMEKPFSAMALLDRLNAMIGAET